MQGSIEQLPGQNRPGSVLLDGVGRASFRATDVVGTLCLGARVSVKKVYTTRQGRVAEGLWVLPPPLGPLEEGNETREEVWVSYSVSGGRRLAAVFSGKMLFRAEHQEMHARIRALISSLLASQGYETAGMMATDAGYVRIVWNLEAKEFQMSERADPQRNELATAVSEVLAQCFQGWIRR